MTVDKAELEKRFTYHAPKHEHQVNKYHTIRNQARKLAGTMASLAPESRELSLALTKLEEAVMWANASIARNEE
jgi:hypothetical protein